MTPEDSWPAHEQATEPTAVPHAEPVMAMLQEHIPLSLILDLAVPGGPASHELLEAEGLPEQEWWTPA
ncbi:hypothetical protein CLV92_11821 [Kineococcus xinjiangensis]|uniref:Uncharacterized protein n=1 Tax=Kineococcus xinjiangensis TaxID=512762 RepID=A0A2S6ICQ7_9ACTN|nr:hypothetical protein [Kineococcus xinjiangensis]PPK91981.1 hypothetical protein CLV92_11821 [Kineococcus xinjiangensis]